MMNRPEGEKSAALKSATEHIELVQKERGVYKFSLDNCKSAVMEHFTTNGSFSPPQAPVPPCSAAIKVHYSFDYAQQVHFPSNPLQPGPLYFLKCRKCSIFGVCCESLPRQVNFLTDEAAESGKGANAVVSRLHYFFEHYGLGEEEALTHADNCSGQNKNNTVVQYFVWRTLRQLHKKITLSFLITGHTKFSPDWCFGLFKRLYQRTNIRSLEDIATTVEQSAKCNTALLVAKSSGEVIVKVFDWKAYFRPHFKPLPSNKTYHHIRCDSSTPGVEHVRRRADDPEVAVKILKHDWDPFESEPPIIPPPGLSAERQWYLYHKIREFCPEETRDIVCPQPRVQRPWQRRDGADLSGDDSE